MEPDLYAGTEILCQVSATVADSYCSPHIHVFLRLSYSESPLLHGTATLLTNHSPLLSLHHSWRDPLGSLASEVGEEVLGEHVLFPLTVRLYQEKASKNGARSRKMERTWVPEIITE